MRTRRDSHCVNNNKNLVANVSNIFASFCKFEIEQNTNMEQRPLYFTSKFLSLPSDFALFRIRLDRNEHFFPPIIFVCLNQKIASDCDTFTSLPNIFDKLWQMKFVLPKSRFILFFPPFWLTNCNPWFAQPANGKTKFKLRLFRIWIFVTNPGLGLSHYRIPIQTLEHGNQTLEIWEFLKEMFMMA